MNRRNLLISALFAVLLGAGAIIAADTVPAVKADAKPDTAKAEAPKVEPTKAAAPKVETPKAAVPVIEPNRRRDRDRTTATPRPAPSGPAAITPDTFRLIGERNIFNPNRTGRDRGRNRDDEPRGETISFVGTMDYAKGRYAFFDGTDRGYQKTLTEGGKIGPFVVKNITADSVDLVRDPNPFSIKMGQQLRKPVGGDWAAVSADVARADAARAAEAAAAAAVNPNAPVVIPADASDALRKMMERRNQTLKQ